MQRCPASSLSASATPTVQKTTLLERIELAWRSRENVATITFQALQVIHSLLRKPGPARRARRESFVHVQKGRSAYSDGGLLRTTHSRSLVPNHAWFTALVVSMPASSRQQDPLHALLGVLHGGRGPAATCARRRLSSGEDTAARSSLAVLLTREVFGSTCCPSGDCCLAVLCATCANPLDIGAGEDLEVLDAHRGRDDDLAPPSIHLPYVSDTVKVPSAVTQPDLVVGRCDFCHDFRDECVWLQMSVSK
jgi:hypothetical protein